MKANNVTKSRSSLCAPPRPCGRALRDRRYTAKKLGLPDDNEGFTAAALRNLRPLTLRRLCVLRGVFRLLRHTTPLTAARGRAAATLHLLRHDQVSSTKPQPTVAPTCDACGAHTHRGSGRNQQCTALMLCCAFAECLYAHAARVRCTTYQWRDPAAAPAPPPAAAGAAPWPRTRGLRGSPPPPQCARTRAAARAGGTHRCVAREPRSVSVERQRGGPRAAARAAASTE